MEKTKYKIYARAGLKTIAYKNCSNVFIDIPAHSISFTHNENLIKLSFIEITDKEWEKKIFLLVPTDFFGKMVEVE